MHLITKILKRIIPVIILVTCATVMVMSVRGLPGTPNPDELNTNSWKESGPFELSPERGRYALTYSLVEDNSFYFSTSLARFVTPDLGYNNGKYVSLFAPGVSFIVSPGYMVGSALGFGQVGAFLTISFIALLNAWLVYGICKLLGLNRIAAGLAGIVFLFATPAFAYAVTLYQHHVSTLLILLSIYVLIRWNTAISLALVWFLCAASIPVDYPNLFLMFPIGIYASLRLVDVKLTKSIIKVKLDIKRIISVLAVALPLTFFMWFNASSYGNPLQFSGTVASVQEIDEKGKPTVYGLNEETNEIKEKSAIDFFKPRGIPTGLYFHFFSPDRGIIRFTPVVLLGLLGLVVAYRKKETILPVLLGVIGMNVLLYSMWGDPWGGWAFGSRYLIPTYAMLAVLIGFSLDHFSKRKLLLLIFSVLVTYSIAVNLTGALTSNANPPKSEAIPLQEISGRIERYSFDRNIEYLWEGGSKSFVFRAYASNFISSRQYFLLMFGVLAGLGNILVLSLFLTTKNEN